ncbi:MAG: AAA family ATPase [Myxococcales bacterium]|nr:AAA family ATPase [Myxococcales bacterium]
MEAVIFIGIQGSGKSSFYRERFFDSHVRINLDMLRTRRREGLLLKACVAAGQRFVVDNTNPTVEDRQRYIRLAREAGFRITGYYFDPDIDGALQRNARRPEGKRIPVGAIRATRKRLQAPARAEGFDELFHVRVGESGDFLVQPSEE